MRNFIILVILVGLGYFGWQTWQQHPEYFAKLLPTPQEEKAAAHEPSAQTAPVESVASAPVPVAPQPREFVSHIVIPADAGEHPMMPPGQFLVLERASVETQTGVIAIVPGDAVKPLERRKDGTMKVTNGQYDFVVRDTQLTQDILLAKQAERSDFNKRYGHVQ